jgi:hypothetical protein
LSFYISFEFIPSFDACIFFIKFIFCKVYQCSIIIIIRLSFYLSIIILWYINWWLVLECLRIIIFMLHRLFFFIFVFYIECCRRSVLYIAILKFKVRIIIYIIWILFIVLIIIWPSNYIFVNIIICKTSCSIRCMITCCIINLIILRFVWIAGNLWIWRVVILVIFIIIS